MFVSVGLTHLFREIRCSFVTLKNSFVFVFEIQAAARSCWMLKKSLQCDLFNQQKFLSQSEVDIKVLLMVFLVVSDTAKIIWMVNGKWQLLVADGY